MKQDRSSIFALVYPQRKEIIRTELKTDLLLTKNLPHTSNCCTQFFFTVDLRTQIYK